MFLDFSNAKAKSKWMSRTGSLLKDMHEPIISQRIWGLAQENLKKRKRADNHGAVHIFAGLVKCAPYTFVKA